MKRLAFLLVLIPSIAHAGDPHATDPDAIKPDPKARRMAAEANLEPERRREGLAFGLSIGGAMQVGFGIDEAGGTGGTLDFRVGTSATDRLAWFLDFYLCGTPRQGDTGFNKINQQTIFGAGAQVFLLETVWLRAGAGLGDLHVRSEEFMPSDKQHYLGLGAFGGGGIDFLRHGRFAIDGEFDIVSGLYRDGLVAAAVFQAGVTWW
jgi:hypothetical protein